MSEEDQTTVTSNTYRQFCEFGHVVFKTCEQTDKHADMLITILHIHARDEVIKKYHLHFNSCFPGEPGLAGSPLDFFVHLFFLYLFLKSRLWE